MILPQQLGKRFDHLRFHAFGVDVLADKGNFGEQEHERAGQTFFVLARGQVIEAMLFVLKMVRAEGEAEAGKQGIA